MSRVKTPYLKIKPPELNEAAWREVVSSWENGLSDREASFRASRDSGIFVTEAELKKIVARDKDVADLRDFLQPDIVSNAKLNIADSIREGSVATSKWYLERKAADEFSTKAAVAFEGAVVGLTMEEKQKELDKLLADFGGETVDTTEDTEEVSVDG